MYEGSGEVTAHALAQAELAHGYVEERFEIENGDHFVAGLRVLVMIDAIDVAEQVKRFYDGQVPPQLRALPKDHADLCNVGDAFFPGDASEDFTAPRIGYEDAGQDFDCGGFARAIGTDVTDEFAGFNGEGDAVESSYLAVVAVHDAAQSTPHTGLALGDLEGFGEVFDNDVGHARSQCAGLQAWAYVIYKIGISARVFQVVEIFFTG